MPTPAAGSVLKAAKSTAHQGTWATGGRRCAPKIASRLCPGTKGVPIVPLALRASASHRLRRDPDGRRQPCSCRQRPRPLTRTAPTSASQRAAQIFFLKHGGPQRRSRPPRRRRRRRRLRGQPVPLLPRRHLPASPRRCSASGGSSGPLSPRRHGFLRPARETGGVELFNASGTARRLRASPLFAIGPSEPGPALRRGALVAVPVGLALLLELGLNSATKGAIGTGALLAGFPALDAPAAHPGGLAGGGGAADRPRRRARRAHRLQCLPRDRRRWRWSAPPPATASPSRCASRSPASR